MNMEFSVLFPSELFFGNSIIELLHAWDPYFGNIFLPISLISHKLGSSIFFLSLLAMVYICFSPKLGAQLAYGLLSAGFINSFAKFVFESPRPMNLSDAFQTLQSKASEHAFGFPSGHVQTSVVIWGYIFLNVKSKPVRIFSLIVIFLMPISRMYLGVHYLGDVVAGFIIGLINLYFLIWFVKKFPDFPNPTSPDDTEFSIHRKSQSMISMILAITLSPTLLYNPSLSIAHNHSLDILISASSSLGGFLVGSILMKVFVLPKRELWSSYIDSESPTITLLVRLLTLVMMIFLFYLLPSILLKDFNFFDHILFRYLRYFIAGLTIVYLTPLFLFHWKNGQFLRKSLNA